jgi:hypothetical protein
MIKEQNDLKLFATINKNLDNNLKKLKKKTSIARKKNPSEIAFPLKCARIKNNTTGNGVSRNSNPLIENIKCLTIHVVS